MNKHITKIIIINSFLFSYLAAMNPAHRDPHWRCSTHTKSKEELIRLGLLDAALCGSALYVGLRNTLLQSFESESVPATIPVIVGKNAEQAISAKNVEQNYTNAKYAFYLSALFLLDTGNKAWKICYYQDYLRQKHDAHNCLTNHQ